MLKKIINNPKEFSGFCSKLKPIMSLDTETTSLSYLELRLIGFSLCDGNRACYVNYINEDILNILQFYISESRLIVMHNAPFDMMVLSKYGISFNNVFDTLTASHLLNENLTDNGLKYLTKTVLNRKVVEYDDAIKFGISSNEFYEYAIADAVNTYDLYRIFSNRLEEERLHHLAYDIEFPFQHALMELMVNGIKADTNRAKEMRYEVRHLYYQLEDELLRFFGGQYNVWITPRSRQLHVEPSINFGSSDQVIPLIEGLGFEIFERTKKKTKSFGKAAKNRLKGKHPVIDKLITLGKVDKLLNSFLIPFNKFVDADGRIRASFHNTVCVTGRLSCSKPNIEQLPNQNDVANIRDLFVAERDHLFIVADYSGQEVRIMAVESGDPTLIKRVCAGYDVHLATANQIHNLGLTEKQLIAGNEEYDKAKAEYDKIRKDTKTVVFGTAYGKGAYGFAKDFNTTENEAQDFIDEFLGEYPVLRERIERCHKQVELHGYVKNIAGRKRRFPDFKKQNKWGKQRCFRQSFNFLIQSLGADMIKASAGNLVKYSSWLKLINIVHDELVFEVHKDNLDKGIKVVKECMESAMKLCVPLKVDISYGERYGEAK